MNLQGKISLYFLNAYNDAHIADEIVRYLTKKKTISQLKSPRAKEYIKTAKNKKELLGIAYTQYYWNGLYDYLFAQFLLELLPLEHQTSFKKNITPIIRKFKSELKLQHDFEEFAKQYGLMVSLLCKLLIKIPFKTKIEERVQNKISLSYKQYAQAIIHVENTNIKNNYKQIEQLDTHKPKTLKQKYLYQIADKLDNKQEFITQAKNTLIAASRWDTLFKWYVSILQLWYSK